MVNQESDLPNIIFSYTFYRLRALKTLYFYVCKVIRKIIIERIFAKIFARNYEKKNQTLGR